ncbi:hypothetical protein F5B21DRAFT_216707 [Xylaria acuta]|nr:hypothetical protein F5B21DRAFT_216707 [Xylaria acuta]
MGLGPSFTVRLAENLKFRKWRKSLVPHFISIKTAALDMDASRETTNSKLIIAAKPSHEGLSFIRTPVDEIKLKGPDETHSCLVYELMRERERPFSSFSTGCGNKGWHHPLL